MTGRTCSLLMLESEEEYQRYDIRPEEDAFVIKGRLVSDTLNSVVEQLGDSLASPKRRFLAFVDRLGSTPGMEFNAPTAMSMALEQMPENAYDVVVDPLSVRQRSFEGMNGKLEDLLVQGNSQLNVRDLYC